LKEILLLKAGVTTIPDLNHDSFLETPFIFHEFNEQKKIADYLDKENLKINKSIQKINDNIFLLEEYKESLIYNVVTGKVDVRGEDI
jgi:type I restriction enzyme S subunit